MFILGLTGSIAMGKSTASRAFRTFGVPVFDADAAVHRLLAPGGRAVAPVGAAFPYCLAPGGGIDRKALGRLVFDDPAALARLEAIVHPMVEAAEHRFLARTAGDRRPLVVLDVPLLYETGRERRVDAVAVVSAPLFVQAQRLRARPGMSPARLATIAARQMADAEKRRRADFVIPTGLERRRSLLAVARVIDAVRGRPGQAWPRAWQEQGGRSGARAGGGRSRRSDLGKPCPGRRAGASAG
jgi:dephospho-CoA kinase